MKQVGSVRAAVSMAAATRALGKGYQTVPSVRCLGLDMWFLERVTMGCCGRVGLGISVEEIGILVEGFRWMVCAVSEVEDKGEGVSMGWVISGPWVLVRAREFWC